MNGGRMVIIGKIPPPIGGVTIHVSRILSHLKRDGISNVFLDLSKGFSLLRRNHLSISDVIHLHTSNSLLRFMVALYFRLRRIPLVLTIHGNLGRFNWWGNAWDSWAVRLATVPIVLNKGSFRKAIRLNARAVHLSAFLSPLEEEKLPEKIATAIKFMRHTHRRIFCTNAFCLSYDTQGNEIYGIFDLVALFRGLSEYALVISDPSGTYAAYFRGAGLGLPENVCILEGPHPFIPVLQACDVFIRATSTDGDSISVKEALFFGKPVIATSVVSRPQDCLLYEPKDQGALAERIREFHPRMDAQQVKMTSNAERLSSWQSLKMIYHDLQRQ